MMDNKDKFNLLYASLIDTFKGYVDNAMKTLASILIAIGWILTSNTTRDYLASHEIAYVLSLTAIVAISIVHTIVSIGFYSQSQEKMNLLSSLKSDGAPYVEPQYYMRYRLSPVHIALNLVMNLSLFTVLFMMIFTLR